MELKNKKLLHKLEDSLSTIGNEEITDILLNIVKNRWFPRNISCAASYCEKLLQKMDSRFYIFGAGSHTISLLAEPRIKNLVHKFVVCIDKRAKLIGKSSNFPIKLITPRELKYYPELPILLSHHEYEKNMFNELIELGIHPNRIFSIYDQDDYSTHLPALKNTKFEHFRGDKKLIAIITVRPTSIVTYQTWQNLLQKYNIIHFNMWREPIEFDYCHDSLDCNQSYWVLTTKLLATNPDLIYVYDQYATTGALSIIIKAILPKTKLVLEMYDFLRLTFDDPEIITKEWFWSGEEFKASMVLENKLLNILDCIVHKERPQAVTNMVNNNKISLFATKPFLPQKTQTIINRTELKFPLNLVWAGSANPTSNPSSLFGDSQILPVIKLLNQQNVRVLFYSGQLNYDQFIQEHTDYAIYAKGNSLLEFHPFIKRERLINKLAELDFGMILTLLPQRHFRNIGLYTTFSSKLLTYLCAGLPVLISEEFSYMAELVERWNVGIILSRKEIGNIKSIIKSCDYNKLKINVCDLQRQISIENRFHLFSQLIEHNLNDIKGISIDTVNNIATSSHITNDGVGSLA